MLAIVLVVLTAVCVLLTVAFLGTLRGIVELRLMLKGALGGSDPQIDAGYPVPDVLLRALPTPQDTALILFISEGCEPCRNLVRSVSTLSAEQVLACVLGDDRGEIRRLLPAEVIVADSKTSSRAFNQLKLRATPVAIVQHGGRIIGHAQGVTAGADRDELQDWWNMSGQLIAEGV